MFKITSKKELRKQLAASESCRELIAKALESTNVSLATQRNRAADLREIVAHFLHISGPEVENEYTEFDMYGAMFDSLLRDIRTVKAEVVAREARERLGALAGAPVVDDGIGGEL